MFKTVLSSLLVGGAALYVSEKVMDSDMAKGATEGMSNVYKYGGAAAGAIAGGIVAHMLLK